MILNQQHTIVINEQEKNLLLAALLTTRHWAKHNNDYDTQVRADQLHTKISHS